MNNSAIKNEQTSILNVCMTLNQLRYFYIQVRYLLKYPSDGQMKFVKELLSRLLFQELKCFKPINTQRSGDMTGE